MKIYYPSYYSDFKCIADKCRHSCCVGWEIYVDGDTLDRYNDLSASDREKILGCIGEDGCISLSEGRRCPFLRRDGLCRIISDFGEMYTSDICREHPRFYHRIGDRVECGIGASCEVAAELILRGVGFADYIVSEGKCDIVDETDFDTLTHRNYIYSVLLGKGTYSEKRDEIATKYAVKLPLDNTDKLNGAISELEYLYDEHRSVMLLTSNRDAVPSDKLIGFFAYLVFRHVSIAEDERDLRSRVGFCILLTDLLASMIASGGDPIDSARVISEEIEYSEDNTASLVFEIDMEL